MTERKSAGESGKRDGGVCQANTDDRRKIAKSFVSLLNYIRQEKTFE